LFNLASDPDYEDTISFGPNGSGMFINNKLKFIRNVMKTHFKAKKFASIVRQLNSYGFQATTTEDRKHIFDHPHFTRD
jgi:hypothetical protein